MGPCKYFFDVPVYRLSEEKYYAERDASVEKTKQDVFPNQKDREFHEQSSSAIYFLDHLRMDYGGIWQFNEIIGYIRLHFLGNQIRGEYFGVNAKKIVRTRRKTLVWRTHKLAPEITVPHDVASSDIWVLIQEYLRACEVDLKGKRTIDVEILATLGPFVDWRALLWKSE